MSRRPFVILRGAKNHGQMATYIILAESTISPRRLHPRFFAALRMTKRGFPRGPCFNFQFSIFNLQLIFLLLLSGCSGCNNATTAYDPGDTGGEPQAAPSHDQAIKLTIAIDNLNRLEEFTPPDTVRQILDRLDPRNEPKGGQSDQLDRLTAAWPESPEQREILDWLNQWLRGQSIEWKPDPMAAAAAKQFPAVPELGDLDSMEFTSFDGYALQEASWLRDLSHWARGDVLNELERAKTLFDWTVRNIQLEPDQEGWIPQFPWEVLLFGRGTAVERAWVYVLLLRQLDIDAAVLAVETEAGHPGVPLAKPVPAPRRGTAGPEAIASPACGRGAWACSSRAKSTCSIPCWVCRSPARTASRAAATGNWRSSRPRLPRSLADDGLLRQMDVGESHPYPFKASDLKRLVVLLEASPQSLTRRMKTLESRLTGDRHMVLTTAPRRGPGDGRPCQWRRATHRDAIMAASLRHPPAAPTLPWRDVQARLLATVPFFMPPLIATDRAKTPAPLYCGACSICAAKLVPSKLGNESAMYYYNMARPSE